MVGNNSYINTITTPNKVINVNITAANQGVIGDPIYFTGFNSLIGLGNNNTITFSVPYTNNGNNTVTINGVTMSFINFLIPGNITPVTPTSPPPINVVNIVQQPTTNAQETVNSPTTTSATNLYIPTLTVNQSITQFINDIVIEEKRSFEKIGINPYCYAIQ